MAWSRSSVFSFLPSGRGLDNALARMRLNKSVRFKNQVGKRSVLSALFLGGRTRSQEP